MPEIDDVTPHQIRIPAFGQADLSNSERKRIHLAASIQPHGALSSCASPSWWWFRQAPTRRLSSICPIESFGSSLRDLPGNLSDGSVPISIIPCTAFRSGFAAAPGAKRPSSIVCLHRPPEDGLVMDWNAPGRHLISLAIWSGHCRRSSVRPSKCLCCATRWRAGSTTHRLRPRDGLSLRREGPRRGGSRAPPAGPRAHLGNHYPASDIPQIARQLYERNRCGCWSMSTTLPVPLSAPVIPGRPAGPRHVALLPAQHVAHSCSISAEHGRARQPCAFADVGGKLWGLVACHHYEPRFVHFEVRAVCELLAEAIATRIAGLRASPGGGAVRPTPRAAHDRGDDARGRLAGRAVRQPHRAAGAGSSASGAALLFGGGILTTGDVPGTPQLRDIGKWLDDKARAEVFADPGLGAVEPRFAPLISRGERPRFQCPCSACLASVLVLVPCGAGADGKLGGDPLKPVLFGENSAELSPRRSFPDGLLSRERRRRGPAPISPPYR